MFLPLVLTLIALVVLPDRVPVHYDIAGNITRWGSKYENLILPGVSLLMGAFFLVLQRGQVKTSNESIVLVVGCGTMALFGVMTVIFLVQAYWSAARNVSLSMDISRILCTVMGLTFIALGNALPKLRRNGKIGVRTSWSQKSDNSWRISQLAGGVAFMVTGIALAIGNVFFVREEQSLAFSLFGIVLMIPVLLITLWVAEKKKTEDN